MTTTRSRTWLHVCTALLFLLSLRNVPYHWGKKEWVEAEQNEQHSKREQVIDHTHASRSDATSIPKVLHFCYLSPHLQDPQPPVPDRVRATIEEWRRMQPGWEIILWNNSLVHQHFPELTQLATNITIMAWVADLLRYQVLEKFGGVYLDTDVVALQPLDRLLASLPVSTTAFTVCENPFWNTPSANVIMNKTECDRVGNAVIGAAKNHEVLQKMVLATVTNTKRSLHKNEVGMGTILYVTGPWAWSSIVKPNHYVQILPSFTFFPCSWEKLDECQRDRFANTSGIFAMHSWAKSWDK